MMCVSSEDFVLKKWKEMEKRKMRLKTFKQNGEVLQLCFG